MNYQTTLQTRYGNAKPLLSERMQERRILRTCMVMALSALLLLVLFPSLRAQDIFTTQNLPRIGVSYQQRVGKTPTLDPKPGGLLQNWDFSTLVLNGVQLDSVQMVNPTKLSNPVPGATVAVLNSINAQRTFYNTTKPAINMVGMDNNQLQMVIGSDPYDIEPIPVKFNALLSAKYGATIVFPKLPAQTIHRRGSLTFTPDGNGTLRVPASAATYSCIRVHWTEDLSDTVFLNNKAAYIAHTVSDRYVWYATDSPIEYLSINQGNVSFTKLSVAPPKDSVLNEVRHYYTTGGANAVEPLDESLLQVYPTPAASILHIRSAIAGTEMLHATLFSLQGQILAEGNADAGEPLDLRVDAIPAQSCVLRVESGGRSYVKKVLIVH